MKLLFCPDCQDVKKLLISRVKCSCKKSWGYYLPDRVNAVIGGLSIPIGFANWSLSNALQNRSKSGMGIRFEAFVIPEECPTIVVEVKRGKK